MARIELTFDAERDVIVIYLHGAAKFGVAQAERYAASLSAKLEVLAENPSFGADYGFVLQGLHRGECGVHAVYYRRTDEGIRVLRILHGRMDAGRHLV